MPVEFTCDGCNRRLRAPDAKAGKRTNCPTCGKELLIPVMGTSASISLPTAGMPVHNPLDKLAAAIPSASEAAAGFNLSKPAAPQTGGLPNTNVKSQAEPIEIGLAGDDPPAPVVTSSSSVAPASVSSSGSSGIGSSIKSKANAWRGGDKAPPPPGGAPKPAIPAPVAPKPAMPAPTAPKPAIPSTAAPKPFAIDIPAKAAPLSLPMAGIPMAGAVPIANAAPTSPLVPIAPTAPNPLDDIFKDIPQLAPISAPTPMASGAAIFGGLKPVTTMDPFSGQGSALPQAAAPRWDQIAASASVSSNPYAAPSYGASKGSYGRTADIDSVRTMVVIPGAILLVGYGCLMAYALFNMVVVGAMLAGVVPLPNTIDGPEEPGVAAGRFVGMIFGASIPFIIALAGLVGSIKMIRLRSRGMAMTAAVMSIFPFCVCFPIGIWAVVVLSQESVQKAFEANDRRHGA